MKVVLDTSVLVAGLRSPTGASRQLLHLLSKSQLEVVASVAVMLEYEAVLKRKDNLIAFGLTISEVDKFLDGLAGMLIPVTSFFLWRPVLKDPADEHILEAAINGGAKIIVTFNVKDFYPASQRFGIEIIQPGELYRRIRYD